MALKHGGQRRYGLRLGRPAQSAGTSLSLVVFGLTGVISASVMAAVSIAAQRYGWAVFFFLAGLISCWFTLAWIVVVGPGRRGYLRFTQDQHGVVLTASRALRVFETFVPVVVTPPTAWLTWRLTQGAPATDLRALVALFLLTLVAWKPIVTGGRRVIDPQVLAITSSGVRLGGILNLELAWDSFFTVTFDRKKGVVFSTRQGSVKFNPADLRCDPALVADLVQYYKNNPEDRAELTDLRVVERIGSDRLRWRLDLALSE